MMQLKNAMNESSSGKKAKRRRRQTREDYESNPKSCLRCGEIIPFEKKYNTFCSQSCAASHNNLGHVRVKTTNPAECAHCGAVKETRANKYCDACIAEGVYNKAQTLEEIKTDRHRREFLIRKRGHTCEMCGLSEWLGDPIPLELDHINGDSDNNTSENLRILCPNCHAKTPFYKGAAISSKNGRHSKRRKRRRKKYADGESY